MGFTKINALNNQYLKIFHKYILKSIYREDLWYQEVLNDFRKFRAFGQRTPN
jgi:hypothetical protein